MKLQGKVVIWPANLDSTKSRKEGRKLTKAYAIQMPRLDEIGEATKRLSLDIELVPRKSRPANWWEKTGYMIIPKKATRTQLLRALASEIKTTRGAKKASEKERK